MRGAKPIPTAIHEKNGNPGKINLNARKATEPQSRDHSGESPVDLSDRARETWNRIAPALMEMRVLTEADHYALIELCELLADSAEYRESLRRLRADDPEGDLICASKTAHPYFNMRHKTIALVIRLMTEFGLTPSSRTRIAVQQSEEADELDKFLTDLTRPN